MIRKLIVALGFDDKNLWDWLQLGIVPIALVLLVAWFNYNQEITIQRAEEASTARDRRLADASAARDRQLAEASANRDRQLADDRADRDRQLADARADRDREIADDRFEQELTLAYLDRMTDLVLNQNLRGSEPGDTAAEAARAYTLTVLGHVNGKRKGLLVRFLYDSDLIGSIQYGGLKRRSSRLFDLELFAARLRGAEAVVTRPVISLEGADLRNAQLSEAYLAGTDLSYADLNGADLNNAKLNDAYLRGADLTAVRLGLANLSGADLSDACLIDVSLLRANLVGTTMPDGGEIKGRRDPGRLKYGQMECR